MVYFDLNPQKKYSIQYSEAIDITFKYKQYPKFIWEERFEDGQLYKRPMGGHKPTGLWYAFGREWIDFHPSCDVNDCDLPPLFEVDVDTSTFIKLTSPQDITAFHDQYYVKGELGREINWLEVSLKYDGIEINPFNRQYSDLYWYRTFDVSSGCIWNLQKVKNIKRLN